MMKTTDTLAAIGVITIVFITVKTVMVVNELINGPTKSKLKKVKKEAAC